MSSMIYLFLALLSFGGIVFILLRKIPLLIQLPEENISIRDTLRKKIQGVNTSRKLVQEKVLDTALTKTRTLASKTETRLADLLEQLRKRTEERKTEFRESYWEQLRRKPKAKK